MDQLSAVRVFVRVADRGSFTQAADDLNLSRSVVSGQVAALEQHLGVRLLNRTTRRVGLTDITLQGSFVRFGPVVLPDSRVVRVQRLYPKTILKPTVRTMLVPVPKAGASSGGFGGEPLRDTELLAWCAEVVRSVLSDS